MIEFLKQLFTFTTKDTIYLVLLLSALIHRYLDIDAVPRMLLVLITIVAYAMVIICHYIESVQKEIRLSNILRLSEKYAGQEERILADYEKLFQQVKKG